MHLFGYCSIHWYKEQQPNRRSTAKQTAVKTRISCGESLIGRQYWASFNTKSQNTRYQCLPRAKRQNQCLVESQTYLFISETTEWIMSCFSFLCEVCLSRVHCGRCADAPERLLLIISVSVSLFPSHLKGPPLCLSETWIQLETWCWLRSDRTCWHYVGSLLREFLHHSQE